MKHICLKHRYGEPDKQGWVTCSSCGESFNVADENEDDEEYEGYIDTGDDEDE